MNFKLDTNLEPHRYFLNKCKTVIEIGHRYGLFKRIIDPQLSFKDFIELQSTINLLLPSINLTNMELSYLADKYTPKINDNNENSFLKFDINTESIARIAPNPNSPPTIGNLRLLSIHKILQDKYPQMKIIIRFDDTDPVSKPPIIEGYGEYIRCINWLGLRIDKIIRASNRHHIYAEYIQDLLSLNLIDVDEENRIIRYFPLKGKSNTKVTDKSIELKEQSSSWICFRRLPHIQGKHLFSTNIDWPTMNFQSTVDDIQAKITHVLRGIDLQSTEKRQVDLLLDLQPIRNNRMPYFFYWGRLQIRDNALSSSKMVLHYKNKTYDQLLECSMLIDANFSPNGVLKYFLEAGFTKANIQVDLKKLKKYIYSADKSHFKIIPPITDKNPSEYSLQACTIISLWQGTSYVAHLPIVTSIKFIWQNVAYFRMNGLTYKLRELDRK